MNNEYLQILGNKIQQARKQLSEPSQKFINNSDDDLYVSAMELSFIIEERFYMNPQDEQDYNILTNIMHLIDMLFEIALDDDDDFMEFVDDYIIIDED